MALNGLFIHYYIIDKEELADDEKLLDEVVGRQVFTFLQEAVIGCKSFHQEEYFVRRLHWLVTTFIAMMPLKVYNMLVQ